MRSTKAAITPAIPVVPTTMRTAQRSPTEWVRRNCRAADGVRARARLSQVAAPLSASAAHLGHASRRHLRIRSICSFKGQSRKGRAASGSNGIPTQATRRAFLLGCARRILSICTCNSVAMFFLASSKLLPRTLADGLLHSPFQPSFSGQKSQSIGMLAVTCRLTT